MVTKYLRDFFANKSPEPAAQNVIQQVNLFFI